MISILDFIQFCIFIFVFINESPKQKIEEISEWVKNGSADINEKLIN